MADHYPEAIFTLSFLNPAIVHHVHNEQFVPPTAPSRPTKRARVHRDTTPSIADAVLTIRPDQVQSAQGIYFGSDTKQCDVFLAPQQQGVSALHFRVTFKFEQNQPKNFLVRNLSASPQGTIVNKKSLVGSAMAGFRKDTKYTIIAGSVIIFLTYHPDKMTAESWQRLQKLSTEPPSLNIVRIGPSTQPTPDVAFDPQSVLARVAKFEDIPAVAHILPWDSKDDYSFLEIIARTKKAGVNTLRRTSDNKVFAVKMMINGPLQTERWIPDVQLQQELHILKELDHPNVIKLVDFCKWPGSLLLVMDYAEYGSLETYLEAMDGTAAVFFARTVMTHVWRGLNYLHGKDISHGDLTPGNILLFGLNPPCCMISDFGEARRGEYKISTATLCYMAPEAVKSLHHRDGFEYRSKPADIWSSGIIACRLLTGQLPPMPTHPFNLRSKLLHWQPGLEKVEPVCRSLLKSIISVDPSTRPTAEQCLHHEWHVDFPSFPSTPLLGEVELGETAASLSVSSPAKHPRDLVRGDRRDGVSFPADQSRNQKKLAEIEDTGRSYGESNATQEDPLSHPDFSLMPPLGPSSLAPTMTSEEFEEFNDRRFRLLHKHSTF